MKTRKLLLTAVLGMSMAAGAYAEDVAFNNAKIYVNPGHGGWTSNDRNLVTINHALGDTTGFYETNTNLRKALQLYHDLVDYGAGGVYISRTKNGITQDTTIDGVAQLVTLSTIAADVESNNIDYFISIHSNASTDGTTTNYPLVLYRGTDSAVGNGLTDAQDMGTAAWPYINNNDITYKSHYTNSTNVRGDISFYGSSSTSTINGNSYTGYLGVLRHGADGFLVEGCFHTYQPERHRLLNVDYCRQEGMRYARAIRSWFSASAETTGDIMGTVKNATHSLENSLYTYKAASMDAYAPLNNVTVTLTTTDGTKVADYTTDDEYNGVFVFEKLTPGTYILDFTALTDYHSYTEEITVEAGTTVFTNVKLTPADEELDEDEEEEEVEYYTHPEQDGDIVAGSEYAFVKSGDTRTATALDTLTIRRSILRDGKYYVLAHETDRTPHLFVINPDDGSLTKEMSLDGLVTEGYNSKEMSWTLSDIGFTNDGVLIGTNSVVIGKASNSYCNGDFYMYAWQGNDTVALEDQTPAIVTTLATNNTNNIAAAGNNNSNLMANSFAINGNFNDFYFYFDSHAGNGWTTTYGIRYVAWNVVDGAVKTYNYTKASDYDESMFGEYTMLTLSPTALNRVIADGSTITQREFEISLLDNTATEIDAFGDTTIVAEAYGANYFRYADDVFMVSPVYTADGYTYGLRLYNITDGLASAKVIGEYENLITSDALEYMAAFGVVDNADIDLYLMVGSQIAVVTTKGVEQNTGVCRILAYDLQQEVVDEDTYQISFKTNITANEATVTLVDTSTDADAYTYTATAGDDGTYTATVNKADVDEDMTYTWKVTVTADAVTRFKKVSEKTAEYEFYSPYGVAIDNSTESPYFGNIYVTNTAKGSTTNRGESGVGIYTFDGGANALNSAVYDCGISWTGTSGEGPRRIAVAADGRIFTCDNGTTNTGIYYIDPATMEGAPFFTGATNSSGSLTIDGTYVGGKTTAVGLRGEGESTQLYAVDATASGASWKKYVNRYDIGESNTWTTAPSDATVTSNYIGNDNNSIVPVSTGYWAAQYRGAGSSSSGNPCLLYFSDSHNETVYESSSIDSYSSQNGALAVREDEGLVVHSYNGGARVLSYKLNSEKIPVVTELFQATLDDQGNYSNAFAFDYAGNLYAVSNSGECLSIYAMPLSDNTCEVAARSTLLIDFSSTGVETVLAAGEGETKVYPNPATDVVTVACADGVNNVAVYNVGNGAQVINVGGNGMTAVTIDVANLAKGVYIVKVNGSYTTKLIKK